MGRFRPVFDLNVAFPLIDCGMSPINKTKVLSSESGANHVGQFCRIGLFFVDSSHADQLWIDYGCKHNHHGIDHGCGSECGYRHDGYLFFLYDCHDGCCLEQLVFLLLFLFFFERWSVERQLVFGQRWWCERGLEPQ